jgi:AraC-like DNA-binding protein
VHTPDVFEVLEIFYSAQLLHQLIGYFPGLKDVINGRRNRLFAHDVKWTPPMVQEIYMQLLHHSYQSDLQHLYFDVKARELLFHFLYSCTNGKCPEAGFTDYEIRRIREAKDILETFIDKKPPTIRELSRMVALNEFKLKRGFRRLFNAGIFDWITTRKMYYARTLVQETRKPMKEIAMMTGYQRISNFITAFRKQFGITPGSIRRSKY